MMPEIIRSNRRPRECPIEARLDCGTCTEMTDCTWPGEIALKLQAELCSQERFSAVGRMASGIAHDFNNVLIAILGLSDLITSRPHMLSERPDQVLDMIKTIHTAGQGEELNLAIQECLLRGSDGGPA